MKHEGADSHSHICAYYKLDEDKCNKWQYNPFTKELEFDRQNDPKNDMERVQRWVDKLDWKTVVEPLVVKPVVNPLELPAVETVTDEQIIWLKYWASYIGSIDKSELYLDYRMFWKLPVISTIKPLRRILGGTVMITIYNTIWCTWDDVLLRVTGKSHVPAIGETWGHTDASVGHLALAYLSTFCKIGLNQGFAAGGKLCEAGLVPCFDGTTWRLHTGTDAHVVYELNRKKHK